MAAFKFDLVSPERLLVSENVEQVIIPATEGEMTVLANHAPVMTTIKPGIVTVKPASGPERRFVVFGGFADILPTGCTLLAEEAIALEDARRADLEIRITSARETLTTITDDGGRIKVQTFVEQMTSLQATLTA